MIMELPQRLDDDGTCLWRLATPPLSKLILMVFGGRLLPIALTTLLRTARSMPTSHHQHRPVGCDTFVAFPPATAAGVVVFGKNSDRPEGEGQSIRRYPRAHRDDFANGEVKCTYISIPQAEQINAVLLSQIDWMWGAEMGANEHGVVIGNEAVWTKEPCSGQEKFLLGMDLVRLGLERGNTAKEAMDVITTLLEQHGQGGPCAEDDPGFKYHNSFLIVDKTEAWVLETADRHWVAERITLGVRNISNCLSIRSKFDLCSEGIQDHAHQKGYWNRDSGKAFDFTAAFCTGHVEEEITDPRFCGGKKLLEKHKPGTLDKDGMIKVLRDHTYGICMHGGFETTASMVSEIYTNANGYSEPDLRKVARHWMTGKPYPCQSDFDEQDAVATCSDTK
jgi:secernin